MLYDTFNNVKNIVEVKIIFQNYFYVLKLCAGEGKRKGGGCYTNRNFEYLHNGFRFQNGPKPLSQLMKESMDTDPVMPVLLEPHHAALDRRVSIILSTVQSCIKKRSVHDVIFTRNLP